MSAYAPKASPAFTGTSSFENANFSSTVNLSGTNNLSTQTSILSVPLDTRFAPYEQQLLGERLRVEAWWTSVVSGYTLMASALIYFNINANDFYMGKPVTSTTAQGSGSDMVPLLHTLNPTNFTSQNLSIPASTCSIFRTVFYTSVPATADYKFKLTVSERSAIHISRYDSNSSYNTQTVVLNQAAIAGGVATTIPTIFTQSLQGGVWYKYVVGIAHRSDAQTRCSLEMQVPNSGDPGVYAFLSPNPTLFKMIPYTVSRLSPGIYEFLIPIAFGVYTNRPTIIATCVTSVRFAIVSGLTNVGTPVTSRRFEVKTYSNAGALIDSDFNFAFISRGQVLFNGLVNGSGVIQAEDRYAV